MAIAQPATSTTAQGGTRAASATAAATTAEATGCTAAQVVAVQGAAGVWQHESHSCVPRSAELG